MPKKKKATKKRVVKKKAKSVKRKIKTKVRKVRTKARITAQKVKAHVQKAIKPQERQVGIVEHFYDGISVAAIMLSGSIKRGDKLHIKGATTDFTQKVESMQIEHESVKSATKGQAIGIKVKDKVRSNDVVYVVG